jgi:tRNA U34 5-carboxymethylaminomethyl modifying GTPase MnmE/TrmE
MSNDKLDEAIEKIRIQKASQAYELADLVLTLNRAKSTDEMMRIHKQMVGLATKINRGTAA